MSMLSARSFRNVNIEWTILNHLYYYDFIVYILLNINAALPTVMRMQQQTVYLPPPPNPSAFIGLLFRVIKIQKEVERGYGSHFYNCFELC